MKTKGWAACLGALTLGGIVLSWNRELKVSEYKAGMPRLPAAFEGMRIVVAADLHKKKFGRGYKILVDGIRASKPDIIIFAGDIYSRGERLLEGKLDLMAELASIAPTYYSTGNHELNDPELYDEFCAQMTAAGVHVLRNRMETICRGEDSLDIWGLELPLKYYNAPDGSYRDLPELTEKDMTTLLGSCRRGRCSILAAHDPFFLRAYASWGADLVVSGHVHGGIIRLPFVGGLLSPERKFLPKYSKGIYRMGRTVMAVTTGLGKLRINNPTEIMLLTLTSQEHAKPTPGREWIIG